MAATPRGGGKELECESGTRCTVPGTSPLDRDPVLSRHCPQLLRADIERLMLQGIRWADLGSVRTSHQLPTFDTLVRT